jgi:hypothetical protein
MSIAESLTVLKQELLGKFVPQLLERLQAALHEGQPVHEVEQSLWDLALQLGHQSLAAWLAAHGTGDIGPTITLPDGHSAQRLPELHALRYRSIFGTFRLQRTAYGAREGQALAFVPLDNHLQLPRNGCSYLLQD